MRHFDLRRAIAVPALIVTFTLAGCGSTNVPTTSSAAGSTASGGAPNGGADEFCLNTIDEVSAASGVDVSKATANAATAFGGACNYTSDDGKLVYSVVTLDSAGAVGTFEASKKNEGVVAIEGLGDDAVLLRPEGPLAILKGTSVLSLVFPPTSGVTDPADVREGLEELGRQAVDRL